MMRAWIAVAGIALAALLIWGLEQATVAPLESGDIYPPYSSLRSDPLGAKGLFESVAALGGIEVERLYKQRRTLEARETLFVLGVDPVSWSAVPKRTLEEYEQLVAGGGRLVIAFLPVRGTKRIPEKREVEQRWNVRLRYASREDEDGSGIPRETTLFFETEAPWQKLGGTSAVERVFGTGSIVLAADTFPLSNEGLRDARDAKFIAALIGPATRLIFDEDHFGVVETGSVTKLIRKYQLEGAVAVLALAAALFLWRSASSFLPPRATIASGAVEGRDSIDGLAALLRRGIAEKDLADVCFAEWNKPAQPRAARVEEAIRRLKHDPAAAYRAASKALTERT
jgi:hypothetical protein